MSAFNGNYTGHKVIPCLLLTSKAFSVIRETSLKEKRTEYKERERERKERTL